MADRCRRSRTSLPLFASEQAAKDQLSPAGGIMAYFEGSVSGLGVGAPVTFQGLGVGQVTSVGLEYHPASDMIRAPVHFEMQPDRIGDAKAAEKRGPLENARILVARGMRAQLQSSNC